MSWNRLPPALQELAQQQLTPKQLAAWKLELAGLSLRQIAIHLDLARSAANDRIENAHRNLRRAGVTQDASGNWHYERTAA